MTHILVFFFQILTLCYVSYFVNSLYVIVWILWFVLVFLDSDLHAGTRGIAIASALRLALARGGKTKTTAWPPNSAARGQFFFFLGGSQFVYLNCKFGFEFGLCGQGCEGSAGEDGQEGCAGGGRRELLRWRSKRDQEIKFSVSVRLIFEFVVISYLGLCLCGWIFCGFMSMNCYWCFKRHDCCDLLKKKETWLLCLV